MCICAIVTAQDMQYLVIQINPALSHFRWFSASTLNIKIAALMRILYTVYIYIYGFTL